MKAPTFSSTQGDTLMRRLASVWLAVTYVSELVHGRPGASRGDRGATAVEYGLMVALIAVVIIGAVAAFGTNMVNLFAVPTSALNP